MGTLAPGVPLQSLSRIEETGVRTEPGANPRGNPGPAARTGGPSATGDRPAQASAREPGAGRRPACEGVPDTAPRAAPLRPGDRRDHPGGLRLTPAAVRDVVLQVKIGMRLASPPARAEGATSGGPRSPSS